MPGHEALFALKSQIKKDFTEERSSQFSFLLSRRPVLRIFYHVLSSSPPALRGMICLLYAASVSARRADFSQGSPVAAEKYANERKQIDFLWPVLAPKGFVRWEIKAAVLSSLFYFIRRSAGDPARVSGFFRITKRLCRRYPLFVAMRGAEAALSYSYFREVLRKKRVKAVVSSSDGNPYGRALMAAARAEGIPLVFVSHGPVAETPVRAKAALAVLHGRAAAEDFARQGSEIGDLLLFGYRQEKGIRQVVNVRRALICLGAAPNLGFLQTLADEIGVRFPSAELVVRPHPHALTGKEELAALARNSGWIISSAPRVSDELSGCDLLLAANSTVHLDGLVAGVPSLYVPGLDPPGARPLSFIREGIVASWAGSTSDINSHYSRAGYMSRLGRYMSQDGTSEDFFHEFGRRMDRLLGPEAVPSSR